MHRDARARNRYTHAPDAVVHCSALLGSVGVHVAGAFCVELHVECPHALSPAPRWLIRSLPAGREAVSQANFVIACNDRLSQVP